MQFVPVAGQRSHWYENAIGVVPVHVPLPARSVLPFASVPVYEGAVVDAGFVADSPEPESVGAWITPVGADWSATVPTAFFAVTATRILAPMSAPWTMYDDAVESGIATHAPPSASHRRHS